VTALWENRGSGWHLLSASGFTDEAALHDLVEEAPHLLPLSGSPALVVVGREVPLGGGYADLVAVEPNGRLVVIEVKLARNAEARRAVVAQILAYAAALHGLSQDDVERTVLGRELARRGYVSLADAVRVSDQDGSFSAEAFADGLGESLDSGRFRLVLVLDEAPADLVRLVGYLEAVSGGLIIDLVAVSAYEIDGSRVIVPRRVEPSREHRDPADRGALRSLAPTQLVSGSDDFRGSIDQAPSEHRDTFERLCDWADALAADRVARLYTRHDPRGWTILLPRLPDEDVGLVSIWNTGTPSLSLWRTVFERRAPSSLAVVERLIEPATMAQSVRQIDDELLVALAAAYREAARPSG
jgi:hypothetical protein